MTERNQRLQEIRERYEASTPGEWDVGPTQELDDEVWVETDHDGGWPICGFDESGRNNLVFIAHAHQDIPYLLAEIERLEAALARERQTNALDEMARDAAADGLYDR